MKTFMKPLCLLLSLCCLIALAADTTQATAASVGSTKLIAGSRDSLVLSTETIPEEDGYTVITTTETVSPIAALSTTKTKSASKTYSYYNANNVLCWTYTLNATFMYDGQLVVCSNVSSSAAIYKSNWSLASESCSKQSNTATGSAKFKNATTSKTANLTITCTKNGTIS